MVAAVRADLYNVAGKSFERRFEVADFMPGATDSVEARARELIEMGYTPSEAAAMATSKQTREHKLHVLDSALSAAHRAKQKNTSRRRA
jgi:hypothetical protein